MKALSTLAFALLLGITLAESGDDSDVYSGGDEDSMTLEEFLQNSETIDELEDRLKQLEILAEQTSANVYDSDADCPPDGIILHDSCYLISKFRAKRTDAMHLCESRGFDLVTVETMEENYNLMWILQDFAHDNDIPFPLRQFWTSGMVNDNKEWMWESTYETIDYTFWAPEQPNATLSMKQECPMKKMMKMKYASMMNSGHSSWGYGKSYHHRQKRHLFKHMMGMMENVGKMMSGHHDHDHHEHHGHKGHRGHRGHHPRGHGYDRKEEHQPEEQQYQPREHHQQHTSYNIQDAYLIMGQLGHSFAWYSVPEMEQLKFHFICEKPLEE